MPGILYGVGVGPGDPELITLKALRIIRQSDVIAIPAADKDNCKAYQIARRACPELEEKMILPIPMPMTKDLAALSREHAAAAETVAYHLNAGKQAAFLTLGDPSVYSTYLYVHRRLRDQGYKTAIISGVPSFCAAAARINDGLAETSQALHILPGVYQTDSEREITELSGTKVLMKIGKNMKNIKKSILKSGQNAILVENCGMPDEKICRHSEDFPDNPSYFSLIIIKE